MNASNIYRNAGNTSKKRGLNDMNSVYCSAVNQSSFLNRTPAQKKPTFTPNIDKGLDINEPSGEDDYSTSKPRYTRTVARNPTLQASFLSQSKVRLNKIPGKLNQNQTHIQDANFTTPVAKYQPNSLSREDDDDDIITYDGHALSSSEFRAAFKEVSSKLDEQFRLSEDIRLSDIGLQTSSVPFGLQPTGPEVVYSPMTFIPTQHIAVPAVVDEEQQQQNRRSSTQPRIVEFSKRNKVIYFGFGNKLIVWDYTQQSQNASIRDRRNVAQHHRQAKNHGMALIGTLTFPQQITCIKELASQNPTTGWQRVQMAASGCLQVLVATTTEIKHITVKKEENQHAISVQESLVQPLNHYLQLADQVNVMVEFEKTGRVFYDGTDGNITEIEFKNYTDSLLGILMRGDRRKMEKLDHQPENMISKMLPSFLKMRYNKEVIELKIDEQRNILYCHGIVMGGWANGQSVIEVFSLGRLGDEFHQLATIHLWQIVNKLFEELIRQENYDLSQEDKYLRAKPFQIKSIEPITHSASQVHHLLVITHKGDRIFLRFLGIEAGRIFQYDIEQRGLQSDLLMTEMLTGTWELSAYVPSFPDDEILFNDQAIARDVCRSLFKIHELPFTRYQMQQAQIANMYLDPSQSLMVYQMSEEQQQQRWRRFDQNMNCLKVCFLKKNEPVYNHYKQEYAEGQEGRHPQACIQENFSVALIRNDNGNHSFPGQRVTQLTDQRHHFMQKAEILLKVQCCKPQADLDTLVMLGLHKPTEEQPSWGKQNQTRSYHPHSEVEKQVYLQGNKIHLLTDQRLIEVSPMRPIDNLVMILMQIARSSRQEQDIARTEFEDFAETHTMRETCAMLVQVLTDKDGAYLISRRVQEIFRVKKEQHLALAREPRNRYVDMQMNRSTLRPGTISLSRNRVGHQTSQANNRIGIYGGGRSSLQQSYSLPRGAAVDQGALIEQEELLRNQDFTGLLTDFDLDNEVECVLQAISQDCHKVALELLTTYGDSVNVEQLGNLNNLSAEDFENVKDSLADVDWNKLQTYSNKHKALYIYLYRVLHPIWELNITSQPKITELRRQNCNIDLLLPVRAKLFGFYQFLNKFQFNLQGKLCQNPNLICESTPLQDMIRQLCRLAQTEQDFIEVAEKQSCKELKAFVRRCLDVIEFLSLTTNTENFFYTILQELDTNMLQQLANYRFKDMVNSDSNPMVGKMLEITVRVQETGDPSKTSDLIRLRARKAQNLCQTLFSPGENRIFIGESLLQNSLNEPDIDKKAHLVKEAMEAFDADPRRVNLATVIPMLVKNANFAMIGYICMKKLKLIDIAKDTNQIEELYDIIVTLICVLDRIITDYEQSRRDLMDDRVDISADGQYAELFLEYLLKVRDVNKHLITRDKLIQLIYNQEDWRLIGHLFNFFLLKGKDVDFIVKNLPKDVFNKHCNSFINQQSKSECLTRNQFAILKRLLEKSRQIKELVNLTVKIITDQIVLKKRVGGSTEWEVDQLTCQERYDLAKWTKLLVGDVQSDRAYGIAEKIQVKNVAGIGQTGAEVEAHINLKKELDECLETLEEQLGAFESAQNKVNYLKEVINLAEQSGQDCSDDKVALKKLQKFLIELDQRMISVRDLTNFYIQFGLLDRKALMLLYKPKPADRRGQEQLKQRQLDALDGLVNDIRRQHNSPDQFEKAIIKQIEVLFNKSLTESLKELLFHFVEQAAIKYGVDVGQINEGYSWQLTEFLFKNMKIKPSEFIKYILERKSSRTAGQTQIIVLTCCREWCQILSNALSVNEVDRMPALEDLKLNGRGISRTVLQDYLGTFVRDEMIKFEPQLARQIKELYDKTSKEFELLLQQHARQHFRPQQPLLQGVNNVHEQQRRPLHQPPQQPHELNQEERLRDEQAQMRTGWQEPQRSQGTLSNRNFQTNNSIIHSSQRADSWRRRSNEHNSNQQNETFEDIRGDQEMASNNAASKEQKKARGASLAQMRKERNLQS